MYRLFQQVLSVIHVGQHLKAFGMKLSQVYKLDIHINRKTKTPTNI